MTPKTLGRTSTQLFPFHQQLPMPMPLPIPKPLVAPAPRIPTCMRNKRTLSSSSSSSSSHTLRLPHSTHLVLNTMPELGSYHPPTLNPRCLQRQVCSPCKETIRVHRVMSKHSSPSPFYRLHHNPVICPHACARIHTHTHTHTRTHIHMHACVYKHAHILKIHVGTIHTDMLTHTL